jgi:DNA-binding response OmpR family regulator
MPFKILVIDDHIDDRRKAISRLPALLRKAAFEVATTADGDNAYDLVFEYNPDLIVLDLKFEKSGIEGWDICKSIRKQGYRGRIIMRTEIYEETWHGVKGYEAGADIYIRSDCGPEEIIALIRRWQPPLIEEFDERLCVNFEKQRVCVRRDGVWQDAGIQPLPLKLLRELALYRGQIMTSTELNLLLWGDEEVDDDRFAACIWRLRQRIEIDPSDPKHIENIRGVGYRFNGKPTCTHAETPEGRQLCLLRGCG